jgi:outer membrane protein W
MRLLLCLAVVLAAAPAWAQRTELALLAGYTTSGDIEMKALTIQELEIAGSFTWGVAISHLFTPRLGAEASWSRQGSDLVVGTSSGRAELFDVSVNQLHGSFVYQFGGEGGSLRPFASVGLGATFFGADDLESETKLSWALGAGLKWFRSARLGARLQARYNPTHLNGGSSDFCDPFGFCQDWLQQFEILGGLVVRF